jgi:hypothetical protein
VDHTPFADVGRPTCAELARGVHLQHRFGGPDLQRALASLALFLGETVLEWRNLIALALVCGGTWLVTTETAAAPAPARAG